MHWVVWPGAFALAIGIFQLAFHGASWTHHAAVLGVEFLLIAAAAISVVRASARDWHKNWLLRRYQAEKLRLLIFDIAVQPKLWTSADEKWDSFAQSRMRELDNLTVDTIGAASEAEVPPAIPPPSECAAIPETSRRDLIEFYTSAWLDSQIAYFGRKVDRAKKLAWIRPGVVSVVFAASVAIVLVHLAFAVSKNDEGSHYALLIAALLPAGFAVVRTFRSALEISRNAKRAGAKGDALNQFEDALHGRGEVAKPRSEDAAWHDFKTLALAQALLDGEQREWLRLMLDAEWIG